ASRSSSQEGPLTIGEAAMARLSSSSSAAGNSYSIDALHSGPGLFRRPFTAGYAGPKKRLGRRFPVQSIFRAKRSSGSKRITESWFRCGLSPWRATQRRHTRGKVEAATKIVVTWRGCRPFGGSGRLTRENRFLLRGLPLNRSFCWAGRPRQRLPIYWHGLDGDLATAYIPPDISPHNDRATEVCDGTRDQ